jgi:hypothetical protein
MAELPRRPAAITQADVARVIRAAQRAGAVSVEIIPDGTIRVILAPVAPAESQTGSEPIDHERKIVL